MPKVICPKADKCNVSPKDCIHKTSHRVRPGLGRGNCGYHDAKCPACVEVKEENKDPEKL